MSSRITQKITYNLHDRGRNATGVDRSNVNVQAMIAKFNSPEVQEHIKAGTLHGYCGHQIRQRYGMIPPETVIIDGRQVMLEPAIRTVFLHADKDGNVTHQQEFYENESGNHVYRQYKAKVGGFSTALNYLVNGSELLPNIMGGFDYVFAQNFADNACLGLFDSAMDGDSLELFNGILEQEIIAMYDGISELSQVYDYLGAMSEKANKLERQLKVENAKRMRRALRQKQIDLDVFDSALCAGVVSFDSVVSQADSFLTAQPANVEQDDKKQTDSEIKGVRFVKALSKYIGG